jgi:hypothetical protein
MDIASIKTLRLVRIVPVCRADEQAEEGVEAIVSGRR